MWHDTAPHQAAGLQRLMAEQPLRLLPVVCPATPNPAALELLWQLCAVLQRLSYPVIVLDGSAAEGRHAPGLAELLAGMPWPGEPDPGASSALAIVPAARGLARLARRDRSTGAADPLAPLAPLFRNYAAVALHASAEQLAPLVQHRRDCVPLVVTGPRARGMVAGYRQLKHLVLHAAISRCMVAALRPHAVPAADRQTTEALQALQRSARQHLGLRCHGTVVAPGRLQDIQRLALQLLENGCTMDTAGERQAGCLPFGRDACASFFPECSH